MKSSVIIVFFNVPITKHNVGDTEHVSKVNKHVPYSPDHFSMTLMLHDDQVSQAVFTVTSGGYSWWSAANTSSCGGNLAAADSFYSGLGPGSPCLGGRGRGNRDQASDARCGTRPLVTGKQPWITQDMHIMPWIMWTSSRTRTLTLFFGIIYSCYSAFDVWFSDSIQMK